jgi:predicted phage tail protein
MATMHVLTQCTTSFVARCVFICSLLLFTLLPIVPLYASTISNEIIATAPDNPTRLTASAGDGSVDLNWVAPVIVGSSPITGYIVEVFDGVSTGPATVVRLGDATQTSARVIGLTNGVSYTFSVRAVNESGPGAYSTSVSKTPVNTAGTGGHGQAISEAAVTHGFLSPMETEHSSLQVRVLVAKLKRARMVLIGQTQPIRLKTRGDLLLTEADNS